MYVEGRLQTRSWDDKTSGQKRYATEIVATTVQFLGAPGAASAGGPVGVTRDMEPAGASQTSPGSDFSPEPPFDSDADIPF